MLDWYHDHGQADIVADVIVELGPFWFWRGHALEVIARLEATIDPLGDDHLRLSRVHALLTWMKAGVGYPGIPEHAERAAEHAALAGNPPPVQSLTGLATYYMTFGGDTERRHRADRASPPLPLTQMVSSIGPSGPSSTASPTRPCSRRAPTRPSVSPTKSATTPSRRGASCSSNNGSRPWRSRCAPSIRTDRWRCSKNQSSSQPAPTSEKRWRSPSSFAVSCSSPAVAMPMLRPRCGERSSATTTWATVEACSTCSPASPAWPTAPGDRRPRPSSSRACERPATSTDFPAPRTSATPRREWQNTSNADRATEDAVHHVRRLDIEATVDLALDTLDDIAADERA